MDEEPTQRGYPRIAWDSPWIQALEVISAFIQMASVHLASEELTTTSPLAPTERLGQAIRAEHAGQETRVEQPQDRASARRELLDRGRDDGILRGGAEGDPLVQPHRSSRGVVGDLHVVRTEATPEGAAITLERDVEVAVVD